MNLYLVSEVEKRTRTRLINIWWAISKAISILTIFFLCSSIFCRRELSLLNSMIRYGFCNSRILSLFFWTIWCCSLKSRIVNGKNIDINIWKVFRLQPGGKFSKPNGNPGSYAAVWILVIIIGAAKVKKVDTITCKLKFKVFHWIFIWIKSSTTHNKY